jgi:predicted ABC-type sugar transport system permease subunit
MNFDRSPPVADAAASAAAAASKITYVGAAGTGFGWLTHSELIGVAGLLLAAAGFVVNAWFSWRREQRDVAEHAMRGREHTARMHVLEHQDDEIQDRQ